MDERRKRMRLKIHRDYPTPWKTYRYKKGDEREFYEEWISEGFSFQWVLIRYMARPVYDNRIYLDRETPTPDFGANWDEKEIDNFKKASEVRREQIQLKIHWYHPNYVTPDGAEKYVYKKGESIWYEEYYPRTGEWALNQYYPKPFNDEYGVLVKEIDLDTFFPEDLDHRTPL